MKPEQQDRFQELINELSELGSASDPVYLNCVLLKSQKYLVNEKKAIEADCLCDHPQYKSLHTRFFFHSMKGGIKRGTLIQMVKDRGGSGRHKAEAEPSEPEICSKCGAEMK